MSSTVTPSPASAADGKAGKAGALIELRGLERHYRVGGELVRALDGVDLDVASGEYMAITGARESLARCALLTTTAVAPSLSKLQSNRRNGSEMIRDA